jgi:branched-chain amino acid aminotransferase
MRGLDFPLIDLERVREDALETISRSGLADAHVRITVTRGVSDLGLDPAGCEAPTVIISALPLRPYAQSLYREGISAILLWARAESDRPAPWVKSTSYQRTVLARAELRRRSAQEGFFLDAHGNVTEGSVSNVFAFAGGVVRTPPASVCLPGIARREVMGLSRALGLDVREEALSPEVLRSAEEVWVTSSLAEVLPVARLEGRSIGTGIPGPLAGRLRALYRERV